MDSDPATPFTVLLVDDDAAYRASMQRLLKADGLRLVEAAGGPEALALLGAQGVNLALLDVQMPGMDGLELLRRIRESSPALPVIMLTAFGDLQVVVDAMKAGASDFLEKSASPHALLARVTQARRIWELENDNRTLRAGASAAFDFAPLIGDAPSIRRLKEAIVQVGPSDASVLIEGETGTGKELAARAIHHHSRRRSGPFVPVDCASISESLMESELFGHVKGAYTGANASEEGLIRSAEGGTVFLDEIGEIPLGMQVKLLRVMQEREVRPVGSSRSQRVDIRVIAATNRHLTEQIKHGNFREDLYYRIAVVTLEVPPLRERVEDVAILAAHFLSGVKEPGAPSSLDPQALERLAAYPWPGNVRELHNVIHRAAVLARGPVISSGDLPRTVREKRQGAAEAAEAPGSEGTAGAAGSTAQGPAEAAPDSDRMESYEKAAITSALAKSGGSRREAARMLGISEATLYRKLRVFDIK